MSRNTIFRVIKIIDEHSLVINGGLVDDLSAGESIEIFVKGDAIIDPYNDNAELGSLDFIKERLEITEAYDKFSICKKVKRKTVVRPSPIEKILSPISQFSEGKESTETVYMLINSKPEERTGRKTDEKIVIVGDYARVALAEWHEG